jgi:hypothetical protein
MVFGRRIEKLSGNHFPDVAASSKRFGGLREEPDLDVGVACRDPVRASNWKRKNMKRYILLGLATVSLLALPSRESKADDFRVYVDPGYQPDTPYYYREHYRHYRHYRHADEYYWHRWHRRHHDYDRDDYDRD